MARLLRACLLGLSVGLWGCGDDAAPSLPEGLASSGDAGADDSDVLDPHWLLRDADGAVVEAIVEPRRDAELRPHGSQTARQVLVRVLGQQYLMLAYALDSGEAQPDVPPLASFRELPGARFLDDACSGDGHFERAGGRDGSTDGRFDGRAGAGTEAIVRVGGTLLHVGAALDAAGSSAFAWDGEACVRRALVGSLHRYEPVPSEALSALPNAPYTLSLEATTSRARTPPLRDVLRAASGGLVPAMVSRELPFGETDVARGTGAPGPDGDGDGGVADGQVNGTTDFHAATQREGCVFVDYVRASYVALGFDLESGSPRPCGPPGVGSFRDVNGAVFLEGTCRSRAYTARPDGRRLEVSGRFWSAGGGLRLERNGAFRWNTDEGACESLAFDEPTTLFPFEPLPSSVLETLANPPYRLELQTPCGDAPCAETRAPSRGSQPRPRLVLQDGDGALVPAIIELPGASAPGPRLPFGELSPRCVRIRALDDSRPEHDYELASGSASACSASAEAALSFDDLPNPPYSLRALY